MRAKLSQPWVPIQKIEGLVQIEPMLVVLGLVFFSWIAPKLILRKISEERKRNLQNLFKNLSFHLFMGSTLFLIYFALQQVSYESIYFTRLLPYVGLGTILWWAVIFVKVSRILVLEYFFLSHMKVAFPVLLVNLFTLLLSILLGGWIVAEIFNIQLGPILATSAIFSLVLGLALQDTLGNLFSGVALQFDKPYEIGDWIEVQTSGQKWVGQVFEISWRATVLVGFTEEAITIPNRVMGQAQISNFSSKYRPIIRSQIFRLPFGSDIQKVKQALLKTARMVPEIRKIPSPNVFVSDTNESWIAFKLIYFIDNYGDQYSIADTIYSKGLVELQSAGFSLANHRITVTNEMA